MEYFYNRYQEKYIDTLREHLNFEGENGIINQALDIDEREINGKKFNKQIRIDFFGISAGNLLQEDGRDVNAYLNFRKILDELDYLNKQKIRIKIRFLFLYPYSVYSHSMIEAETTDNRSAIRQPNEKPDYFEINPLTNHDFEYSSIIERQIRSLKTIQILIERINKKRSKGKLSKITPGNENQILVRFTPISPSSCGLIINKTAFYDSYQFSKINRDDSKLAITAPVIQASRKDKGDPDEIRLFCGLADHFRYMWRHYLTLDMEDATHYHFNKKCRRYSLSIVKPPSEANYSSKADRIKRRMLEENPEINKESLERDLKQYRVISNNLLDRFCDEPSPSIAYENLFITCSWKKGDDHESSPNVDASHISKWIKNDFAINSSDNLLNVNLFIGKVGESFSESLYSQLRNTTLALVILSVDIIEKGGGKKFSRPNMYHELGYMMRHLSEKKIHVQSEEGVEIPSNISDLIHGGNFKTGKIALKYCKVLRWLFDSTFVIGIDDCLRAMEKHKSRLKNMEKSKILTKSEAQSAIKNIDLEIKIIRELE